MRTHGSESYWILGEGLVSVSGEGRTGAASRSGAGARADETPAFRFSRMGPRECR